MCYRRHAASLKHATRCMSLRTCTRKWPAGPVPEYINTPPLACCPGSLALSNLDFRRYLRGALRRIPQELSHGRRQPSCAIYVNERTPPRGHAWHPPGWRLLRVRYSRFHASVADAVYLAIAPSSILPFQGSKLPPQHGKVEKARTPAQPGVHVMNDPWALLQTLDPHGRDLDNKAHRKCPQNSRLARPHEARGLQRWQAAREARPHDPGHSKPPSSRILALHPSVPSQFAICSRTYTLVCCSSAVY